jgi:hypothetical protein
MSPSASGGPAAPSTTCVRGTGTPQARADRTSATLSVTWSNAAKSAAASVVWRRRTSWLRPASEVVTSPTGKTTSTRSLWTKSARKARKAPGSAEGEG